MDEAEIVADKRGGLIAEGEFAYVQNFIEFETFKRNKVKKIRWKCSEDEKIVEACVANEGAGEIRLGEKFPKGQLMPPTNIMCRCFLLPIGRADIVHWRGEY